VNGTDLLNAEWSMKVSTAVKSETPRYIAAWSL